MREINVEQHHIADLFFCGVGVAPSRIKYPDARLGVFVARTFNKPDVTGQHYWTIAYPDVSLRQPPRHMYGEGALKVDMARFSKYELLLIVQGVCFEQITELPGKDRTDCCVQFLSVCARISTTISREKRTKSMSCTKADSRLQSAHER